MSVFEYPRIYIQGEVEWDPSVTNNSAEVFNDRTGQLMLNGRSEEEFREQEILGNVEGRGDWNLYGTNTCKFINVTVSGVQSSREGDPKDDPLVGKQVDLLDDRGAPFFRLVDINPYRTESQIFFSSLRIGDGNLRIQAQAERRIFSRWINFLRNFNRNGTFIIAGSAGNVWQTAISKDQIEITNDGNSPILEKFSEALSDARGIILRFSNYGTHYFYANPEYPDLNRLAEGYRNGFNGNNPAKSYLLGTIGIWRDGELATVPTGRLLLPIPVGNPPRPILGPIAVAPQDDGIGLDLINGIPEVDESLEKANLGELMLRVRVEDRVIPLGSLQFDDYNQLNYERTTGLVHLDLFNDQKFALEEGVLELAHASGIVLALELTQYAVTDDQCVYLDEDEEKTVEVRVFDRGSVPREPMRVLLANYDYNYRRIVSSQNPAHPHLAQWHVEIPEGIDLPIQPDGTVHFSLRAQHPGSNYLGFLVYKASEEPPLPTDTLQKDGEVYMGLRVLPFDNFYDLVPNEQLTWDFMYKNVFRYYNVLYPGMAKIINLGEQTAMESLHDRIATVVGEALFEKTTYMPVTRELSAGKRRLIERWSSHLSDRGAGTV